MSSTYSAEPPVGDAYHGARLLMWNGLSSVSTAWGWLRVGMSVSLGVCRPLLCAVARPVGVKAGEATR
jgi:hypothetical protein